MEHAKDRKMKLFNNFRCIFGIVKCQQRYTISPLNNHTSRHILIKDLRTNYKRLLNNRSLAAVIRVRIALLAYPNPFSIKLCLNSFIAALGITINTPYTICANKYLYVFLFITNLARCLRLKAS